MNSSSDGIGSALAKSVTNITAPLSTHTATGACQVVVGGNRCGQLDDLRLRVLGTDQHGGQLAPVAVVDPGIVEPLADVARVRGWS